MTEDHEAATSASDPLQEVSTEVATAQREESTPPSLEATTATLDSEISRLEQEVTRSGITDWATVAALAAVGWLFLAEVGSTFKVETAILIAVYVSAIKDCLDLAIDWLGPSNSSFVSRVGYARASDAFGGSRFRDVLICGRGVALVVLAWYYLPVGPTITLTPLFTISALDGAFRFVFSWKRDAYLPQVKARQFASYTEIPFAIFGFLISIRGLLVLDLRIYIAEWRIALLCTAGVYLVLQLGKPYAAVPALARLREIRRDVGFGRLPIGKAVDEAELVLVGLSSAVFLMPKIHENSNLAISIKDECKAQSERLRMLKDYALSDSVDVERLRVLEALCAHVALVQLDLFRKVQRLKQMTRLCESEAEKYLETTRGDDVLAVARHAISQQMATVRMVEGFLGETVDLLKGINAVVLGRPDLEGAIRTRMIAACSSIPAQGE